MKTFHKIKITLFIVVSMILSSQLANSQIQPKFTFKHEDVNGYIGGLAFSHDNTKLLTTGGRYAMMWDLKTGEKIMTLPPYSGFGPIDFSLDDKQIVTSHVKHANVAIWDAQSGKEIKTIQGEIDLPIPSMYTAVAFTLDGEKILGGNDTGGLFVIDVNQGKVVQKFKELGGYVYDIQIYPDGKKVVASQSVVSLDRGEIIKKFENPIYLSYDSNDLYSFAGTQVPVPFFWSYITFVWDANTFEKKNEYPPFIASGDPNISPNGKMIAVVGKKGDNGETKESPHIIDIAASINVRTFSVDKMPDITFDLVKFSRDGKMIVYVKGDTAYLYDISDLTSGIPMAQEQK